MIDFRKTSDDEAKKKVYIGVDYKNTVASKERGRKSMRLKSKRVFSGSNLVILGLDHMPTTTGATLPQGCSIWPAFWTVDESIWPNGGEIDVIEYVNSGTSNYCTLHTNSGCDMTKESLIVPPPFLGSWYGSKDCVSGGSGQNGCPIKNTHNSAGASWNSQYPQGGVWVLEWDKNQYIRVFFFPYDQVPQDILDKVPNPSSPSWGLPQASFYIGPSSTCPSDHFVSHSITFDLTFCGDWAGKVFPSDCKTSVSCNEFVANNPSDFCLLLD